MELFILFGIPKILKKQKNNYILRKLDPFQLRLFTGYISIPIWITVMSKLEILQN